MSQPRNGKWLIWLVVGIGLITGNLISSLLIGEKRQQEDVKVVEDTLKFTQTEGDLSCLKGNNTISVSTEGNCKISCIGESLSVVCKSGD